MTSSAPRAVSRILCGADGSPAACRAAAVASCLARDLDAQLTFISVARAMKLTPELEKYVHSEGIDGAQFPNISQDAEYCLQKAAEIASECNAPTHRRYVEIGDPFEKISERIQSESIDLVVLGSHNRSSVSRLVHKSLSQRFAEDVGVKILLVP